MASKWLLGTDRGNCLCQWAGNSTRTDLSPQALPVVLAAGERDEEKNGVAVLFGAQASPPLSLYPEASHPCGQSLPRHGGWTSSERREPRAPGSLWPGWLSFPRSLGDLLPEWKSVAKSPDSAPWSPSIRPRSCSAPAGHTRDTLISECDSMSIFQRFATTFWESKL